MQFDDKFFKEVGLGEASDEERAAFIEKLSDLVLSRIAVKLSEALSEEQLQEFDSLLEKEGDDAAFAYVRQVYPKVDEMMAKELETVKQQFRSDVSEVMSGIDVDSSQK